MSQGGVRSQKSNLIIDIIYERAPNVIKIAYEQYWSRNFNEIHIKYVLWLNRIFSFEFVKSITSLICQMTVIITMHINNRNNWSDDNKLRYRYYVDILMNLLNALKSLGELLWKFWEDFFLFIQECHECGICVGLWIIGAAKTQNFLNSSLDF